MALEDELAAAIDKDLPNQIGSRLKQRLEDAELTETMNTELEQSVDRLTKEVEKLRSLDHEEMTLRSERERLDAKSKELEQREQILEIKEQYAEKGKADMHMMMGTIFKCPEARQLAFNLYGNASGVTNAQGYAESPSVSLSGDITDKEA